MDRKDESTESFVGFGEIDKHIVDGEIDYHSVTNPLYWTIQAEGFLMDNYDIGLCSHDHKCNLVIDSGTSIIAGPPKDIGILMMYLMD